MRLSHSTPTTNGPERPTDARLLSLSPIETNGRAITALAPRRRRRPILLRHRSGAGVVASGASEARPGPDERLSTRGRQLTASERRRSSVCRRKHFLIAGPARASPDPVWCRRAAEPPAGGKEILPPAHGRVAVAEVKPEGTNHRAAAPPERSTELRPRGWGATTCSARSVEDRSAGFRGGSPGATLGKATAEHPEAHCDPR